ncbi:MAG: DUF1553 domain-containing protein, partial [Planctomycetota bacterium]
LRRVTIDLTGRLPTEDEIETFERESVAARRGRLVDRLMMSDAFVDYWTYKFATWLRISSQPKDPTSIQVYHRWLREQIAGRVGYDKIARELLTASGDTHVNGAANFYRTHSNPRLQAEFASELFMGARVRCANCHNHPLDRWTQDDYHGLAAIFAKVRVGRVIAENAGGKVVHPRTGDEAVPRIPGQHFLQPTDDPRAEYANWLTTGKNPFFAKAMVNRLWQAMMGRGLVEPVDDLRDTNPATHPELLDELAADFVDGGFQFRDVLRRIALSDAYGRSGEQRAGASSVDHFYSHFRSRSLPPEVLADAISDVLGVPERYGDLPLGTRAVTLVDPKTPSQSLDVLGRCSREGSCESETAGAATGGLPRKLHLLNGRLINERLKSAEGRLATLVNSGASTGVIVRTFYQAALTREPSQDEQAYWQQELASDQEPERSAMLEDFVWSLLTSNEFMTNH